MKKIQDIISGSRKQPSIRDVSIERDGDRPQRRAGMFGGGESMRGYAGGRTNGRSFGAWFIAVLVILFLFFAFTILFSGTKVVVTQRTEQVSFETNFTALKDAEAGRLSFDTIVESDITKRTVPSSGEEFVETKASGTIVVYNNYSTASQKLIANTRFQSDSGLIYRIKDPIIVPGIKKDSKGNKIPGSLEVVVYADKAGSEYNIDNSDFTVPGLKGTDQYDGFYARTKTEISGGFSGMIKKVSETDRKSAVDSMRGELRDRLIKSVREQIPEGYLLYDDAMEFVFSSEIDTVVGEDKAELTEKGEVRGIVFSKGALAREIAGVELDKYDGLPVNGVGIEGLLFVLNNPDGTSYTALERITFTLKGNMVLVWLFDESALKEDLVGKKKRDVDWVLSDYPSIKEAQIIMRPFWKRNFPDDPGKIKIVYTSEE